MKNCFLITPIGDVNTETRHQADGLLKILIKHLSPLDFNVTAAHKLTETGNITDSIIRHLIDDELVIAQLTSLNNNVMYELGVRHVLGKHVIPIALHGTKLPFDIALERTIFYHDNVVSHDELIETLISFVKELDFDEVAKNPITRVETMDKLLLKSEGIPDYNNFILTEIQELRKEISLKNEPVIQDNDNLSNIITLTLKFNTELSTADYSKMVTLISNLWRISHTHLDIANGIGRLQLYFYASGIVNHKLTLRTIKELLESENLPPFFYALWN